MSQCSAVKENISTGNNAVPHSLAVSNGGVDPQPVPLGRVEEFIWIWCPDYSQSFVFICKCWMLVHVGGIPPPSGQGRERPVQKVEYGCNYHDAHVLTKYLLLTHQQ